RLGDAEGLGVQREHRHDAAEPELVHRDEHGEPGENAPALLARPCHARRLRGTVAAKTNTLDRRRRWHTASHCTRERRPTSSPRRRGRPRGSATPRSGSTTPARSTASPPPPPPPASRRASRAAP